MVGANLPGLEGSAGRAGAVGVTAGTVAARLACAGCSPAAGAGSSVPPRHLPGAGCGSGASWRGLGASGSHLSGYGFPAACCGGTGAGEVAGWASSAGVTRPWWPHLPRPESQPRSLAPAGSGVWVPAAARTMRALRRAAEAPRGLGRAVRSYPSPSCSLQAGAACKLES